MSFDFKTRLTEGANQLQLELTGGALTRLEIYFQELKKWARKVNLIARSSSDENILEKHFLDSLTILPLLHKPGAHLLDVGTGAGFPGLVCKAAWPELKLTLVEPRQKRVSFLRHIVRTISLQDVTVLDCRIEDEDRLPSNSFFSHATSRAVSDIDIFLGMVERFSAGGARIICMKGPKWQTEVEQVSKAIHRRYFREQVIEHRLPFSGASRALLIYVPL